MRYLLSLLLVNILCVLSSAAFQLGHVAPTEATNQPTSEEQFEAKRHAFSSGRELLLRRGVPFDPDELLHEDWPKKLRGVLDAMPEMQEVRYETAPLAGVYICDTLYLPERVKLAGDAVIITHRLVFEGNNPLIKGPHDLHVFPLFTTAVLGTSLSEALQKAGFPGVRDGEALPSFDLIQELKLDPHEPHKITFDTSGAAPEPAKHHR